MKKSRNPKKKHAHEIQTFAQKTTIGDIRPMENGNVSLRKKSWSWLDNLEMIDTLTKEL